MKINLKNYTSGVPPTRSVSQIEQTLVSIGAKHIAKTYDDNSNLSGITFQITQDNRPMIFKLPANVELIEKMMLDEVKRPRRGTIEKTKDQAQRTAWKLLLDWVEVQASMIIIGRREAMEVFLPYAYDPQRDQTFFERLQETKFKMLSAGN